MMPIVRKWSAEELAKLKTMAESGASAVKVAVALRRNVNSVKKQARIMGVHLPGVREIRQNLRAAEEAAQR